MLFKISKQSKTGRNITAALLIIGVISGFIAAKLPVITAFAAELTGAFEVTVEADGKTVSFYTQEQTASEIVSRAGIDIGEYDCIYPEKDTFITGSATVRVVRAQRSEEVVLSDIEFETETRYTDKLEYGVRNVLQQGVNGRLMSFYEVITNEFGEKTCHLMHELRSAEPVNQIVEVGTGKTVKTKTGETLQYTNCFTVKSTAYTTEGRPKARTATGTTPKLGTIAVDPKVIPLGTRVYITSADGKYEYGVAVAEDTGGKIKGNKIDVFFPTKKECISYGVRDAVIYILK